MALVDYIEKRLPGWARRPSRLHWARLAETIALIFDVLIDGLYEGRLAAMPGQVEGSLAFESIDALPLIGRDRGMVRGFTETTPSYAAALRGWLGAAGRKATAFELLAQLRRVLGPNPPRVRCVSPLGTWHTIEADGTRRLHFADAPGFQIDPDGTASAITTEAHPWDWGDPFTLFVIIYAPTNEPLTDDEGEFGDGTSFWGDPNGLLGTVGTTATLAFVELIRGLILAWTPAGIRVPRIIVAFDDASFDPETPGPYPAAGFPDGTWERGCAIVGGKLVRTRLDTARYWRGPAY